MKKSFIVPAIIFSLNSELFGVCAYKDCGQEVYIAQELLMTKLSAALVSMSDGINNISQSYDHENDALAEQVAVIKLFKKVSLKNNLLLQQIVLEEEKQNNLLDLQNKLLNQQAEILTQQTTHLTTTNAIKSEELQ